MEGRASEALKTGTSVLVITSPEMAHSLIATVLSRGEMTRLCGDFPYAQFLDRLEANTLRGVQTGTLQSCRPITQTDQGVGDFAVEFEVTDVQPLFRTDKLIEEALAPVRQARENFTDPDPFNLTKIYGGPNALSRSRRWRDFIDMDPEVIAKLQICDDPQVLAMMLPKLYKQVTDLLPIDEHDPAIQKAVAEEDRDALFARLREVWTSLPSYQPIALVIEDNPANRTLLRALYQRVEGVVRNVCEAMFQDLDC